MMLHAVLFDLDGTLLDTLRDIADSANAALAHFGFPEHKVSAYRYFVGEGVERLALRALPENSRDQAALGRVVSRINEEYSARWADNTRPFEGIPELLDDLTKIGIRLAILSNKGQSFAELTVARLLPSWHFEVVLGAQASLPLKPDPAGALMIAGRMKLAPGEFLYLGDSGVDMKTAAAADMYPVGALWGFRTVEELLAGGAKALASTPGEVAGMVGKDQ